MVNLHLLQKDLDDFFTEAQSWFHITSLNEGLLGRVELTVKLEDHDLLIDDPYCGLLNGFSDVLDIVRNAKGYDSRLLFELGKFSLCALRGHANVAIELLRPSTTRNSVQEMMMSLCEVRAQGYSFWSGVQSFNNAYYWAPRIQASRGRPIYNPFNASLNIALSANTESFYAFFLSHLPTLNFEDGKKTRELVSGQMAKMRLNLLDPMETIILSQHLNREREEHVDRVCQDCWEVFPSDGWERLYDEHPCEVPTNIRDYKRVHPLNGQIFQNYMLSIQSLFSEDQRRCSIEIIQNRPNILLHGPAGYGKTFVGRFLILWMISKYGTKAVIVASMLKLNVTQTGTGGETLHKIFKLPHDNVELALLINKNKKFVGVEAQTQDLRRRIQDFVNRKFRNPEEAFFFLNVEVIFIDEAGNLNSDLLEFIHLFLIVIRRCKKDVLFGGVQIVLTGDALQSLNFKLKGVEVTNLMTRRGHEYSSEGSYFFFTSKLFSENFKIGLLYEKAHRFGGAKEWNEFLLRARTCSFVAGDEELLCRVTNSLDKTPTLTNYLYCLCANALAFQETDFRTSETMRNFDTRRRMGSFISERIQNPLNLREESSLNNSFSNGKNLLLKMVDKTFKFTKPSLELILVTENSQKEAYSSLKDLESEKSEIDHISYFSSQAVDEIFVYDQNSDTYSPANGIEGQINEELKKFVNGKALKKQLDVLKFRVGDVIRLTSNACGKYLSNNQAATIIEVVESGINGVESIKVHPIDSSSRNRQYQEKVINRVSIDYELANGKNEKRRVIRRLQFSFVLDSSLTIASSTGLTIGGKICIDNTRGTMEGQGYIAITRSPDPKNISWVNAPNLQFDFKTNTTALAFENCLMVLLQKNRGSVIIFEGEYFFDGLGFKLKEILS